MREMVSPTKGAQLSWRIFGQDCASGRSGMVSVTTTSSKAEFLMRSMAFPEKTGCAA